MRHSPNSDVAVLRERIRRRDREAEALLAKATNVRGQLASALELLENRTQELKDAQAFLTKADSLSGADEVIVLVEALNAEIFQLAAFMADSFEVSTVRSHAEEDQKAAYQRALRAPADLLPDFPGGPRGSDGLATCFVVLHGVLLKEHRRSLELRPVGQYYPHYIKVFVL